MLRYHHYTVADVEQMYPFELDIYSTKLKLLLKNGK